ncbi:MAG: threonine/serine exporter family protein [Myxococcaceae bacterium]
MSERLNAQLLLDYLVELGTALMTVGCPTHRLEELLLAVARREGREADVFAVPTGLFIGLRTPEGEPSMTTMVRVTEWANDLERLWALDEVLNEVADRTLTIPEARQRIREVLRAPSPWPRWVQLLASAAASGGAAVSFGGGVLEALVAAVGGVALRSTMLALRRSDASARENQRAGPTAQGGIRVLENLLGGVLAGLFAWVASALGPAHREVLVLSIIIPLLPGLTLTTGLVELTHKNLVAGTARMMHAAITLLSLVFGIALVVWLETSVGLPIAAPPLRESAPWWLGGLSTFFAALGFAILLGLPRAKMSVALWSGAVVWLASAFTRPLGGPQAAFLNALALALAANVWARTTRHPAQVLLMPGLLLLVPGALSFRSLDSLLRGDAVTGLSGMADVILIAAALVMGLLVANVALPSNKSL